MYMNDLTTELAMELGMQKAYVEILHRIIKNGMKNQAVLDHADRILAESKTAKELAKEQVKALNL
jgi:DNA repair protein RadC